MTFPLRPTTLSLSKGCFFFSTSRQKGEGQSFDKLSLVGFCLVGGKP